MATLMLVMVTTLAGVSQIPLDRVHAAADSLWATFWQPAQQYLVRDAEASRALLPFFSYQEATHAIALVAGLDYNKHGPQLKAMVSGQDRMNTTRQPDTGTGPGPSGSDGWTRPFFSDMNWAVLALLAAHDVALAAGDHDAAIGFLNGASNATARNVMGSPGGRPFPQTVVSARDTDTCGGGLFEDRNRTRKGTAVNAGAALSAALLAVRLNYTSPTSGPRMAQAYRDWAEQVYSFWNQTMTDAVTGVVADCLVVNRSGACTRSMHGGGTYNEGLMLGAATALGHDADAARFATRLATAMVAPSIDGAPVLHDACEDSCDCCDCQSFKGVAVRELHRWLGSSLSLHHPTLRDNVTRVLSDSAAAVWEHARQEGDHGPLFSSCWSRVVSSADKGNCSSCSFNAAAQTSAIFALLSQV